jgi:hypothetical protein
MAKQTFLAFGGQECTCVNNSVEYGLFTHENVKKELSILTKQHWCVVGMQFAKVDEDGEPVDGVYFEFKVDFNTLANMFAIYRKTDGCKIKYGESGRVLDLNTMNVKFIGNPIVTDYDNRNPADYLIEDSLSLYTAMKRYFDRIFDHDIDPNKLFYVEMHFGSCIVTLRRTMASEILGSKFLLIPTVLKRGGDDSDYTDIFKYKCMTSPYINGLKDM